MLKVISKARNGGSGLENNYRATVIFYKEVNVRNNFKYKY